MTRFYYVFNVAQCDGLKNIPAPVETPFSPPTKPEEIVAFMPKRPEIKHGMRKAFYSPGEDIIAMPDRERFDDEAGYYATLYHEMTHSTGHPSRLNRPTPESTRSIHRVPAWKPQKFAVCWSLSRAENAEQFVTKQILHYVSAPYFAAIDGTNRGNEPPTHSWRRCCPELPLRWKMADFAAFFPA